LRDAELREAVPVDVGSDLATYRIKTSRPGEAPTLGTLSDTPRIIGRAPDSDIVLLDDCVSRRHARLFIEGDTAFVEDLGSSNGILVNGVRVQRLALSPSDQIQVGHFTIQLEPMTSLGPAPGQRRTELEYKDVAPLHQHLVDQDHSALSFLYRLSQHMSNQRGLRPLLQVVLEQIMENLPAGRGFILASGEQEGAPEICVSLSKHPDATSPPISQTLVRHVQGTRSSVLTMDAGEDDRFDSSDSIVAHQIKAAICTPLTCHDRVYGVIYVDTDSDPAPFTQTHLQLLSVVGQVAGAAIENVQLIERQIHQERLAAIGQTVSATSHDMRNILTGISGGSEILDQARERESWDHVERANRIIRRSMGRFEELVNSLLTYARKTSVTPEETALGDIIREVIEGLEREATKRGVAIEFEDGLNRPVMLDGQQIHRVLLNLMRNALDAMDKTGGTLRIETAAEDSTNLVRIKDTGHGIAEEHLSRIGQAFFTTRDGHGTGLGLAVCYRIMEQHEGRVLVESTPGKGTQFTLVFPDHSRTTARFKRVSA